MPPDARPSTAADVARLAGVDRSTVSRVLNRAFDHHRYSPDTIRSVEAAARKLNYRPSSAGRSLRTGRSTLIGLLVGDVANSFFGALTASVEAGLREHRYRLMVASTHENPELQQEHLDDLRRYGVAGVIVAPVASAGLASVEASGVPVVLIDRPLARCPWPYVGIDNFDAGRQLGEHLRRSGYRSVGVVGPRVRGDATLRWRLQGLRAGLGIKRIAWEHVVPLRPDRQARAALAHRLSHDPQGAQAVVGLTNDSTVTAMEALRDAGLKVPGQVGLAGIDDFRAAELLDPPLTVVAQPIDDIARRAVEHLMALIDGGQRVCDCLLPARLVERSSLRPLTPLKELT